MTPLTQDPTLVVLINENREIVATATNVAQDLKIVQTRNVDKFTAASQGMPFVTDPPEPAVS